MFGLRSPRAVLVALTIGLAVAASGGALAGSSVASAATPHRAAVIIDTGATVHRVVITFTEDSISGIDALSRAGASPVVYAMGPGAAVCRLYGIGRDPGSNCLGGQDGDNRYWAYFRAPAGTAKFTYSSVGAGASRVHDGDIEGWKYGTGVAPAYVSLASLVPPPPPPPTSPPATVAPAPASGGGSAPVGDGGAAPVSGAEKVTGPAAGTATTSSTTPAPGAAAASGAKDSIKSTKSANGAVDHETDANGKPIHTKLASADNGGGGGSSWSLILFAVLIVAIAAAIIIVRRYRNRPAST